MYNKIKQTQKGGDFILGVNKRTRIKAFLMLMVITQIEVAFVKEIQKRLKLI